MSIDIETAQDDGMMIQQCPPLVPLRVKELKRLVAGEGNVERFKVVQDQLQVGSVCVVFEDNQHYRKRLLNCRTGYIVPLWYDDYVLLEYTHTVRRVSIAKSEN